MILERPEEPGKKYALAFTFMVHAGLIAALFLGVQWKRSAAGCDGGRVVVEPTDPGNADFAAPASAATRSET
jgi:hypothetical protein